MPGIPRSSRAASATAAALTVAVLLTACAGGQQAPAQSRTATDTPSPTATEEPAVGLGEVDLGTGEWLFSAGGFAAPVSLAFQDGTATAGTIAYTLTEPVYSDANGDGLEDALVAIEAADGNGFESLWYLFVADGEGAVQIPFPVARAARCGDAVLSTSAVDGGFAIEQALRVMGTDDALPCAEQGTGLQRKVVTVSGDVAAGAPGLWPVQVEPVPAWGGLCSDPEWLDSEGEQIELFATPDAAGPIANAADAVTAVVPVTEEPWAQLPSGSSVSADTWAFIGYLPGALGDDVPVRMQCAFAPRG